MFVLYGFARDSRYKLSYNDSPYCTCNVYRKLALILKQLLYALKTKINAPKANRSLTEQAVNSQIDYGDSRKPINSQSMTSTRVTNNLSECLGGLSRYFCEKTLTRYTNQHRG